MVNQVTNVLIDTDAAMGTLGADPEDSLAILFALNSPELAVRAITCVQGNVPVRHSYPNVRHLLSLIERTEIPVAAGADRPLMHHRLRQQMHVLAEKDRCERLVPFHEGELPRPSAAELIIATAQEWSDLNLICIGPLTNVAAALVADPQLRRSLRRLVVMGGAFNVPGNIHPKAEFNFWMDPEAAAIVLAAGIPCSLVGLDVCKRTRLTREQLDTASAGTALGDFARASCEPWLAALSEAGPGGLHLYDSLAAASAAIPAVIRTEPAVVTIATDTQTPGASVHWAPDDEWTRPAQAINADVAVDLDLERFDALFAERVLKHF